MCIIPFYEKVLSQTCAPSPCLQFSKKFVSCKIKILRIFCPIILQLYLIRKNDSIATEVLSSVRLYSSAAFPSPNSIIAHHSGVLLSSLASTSFHHFIVSSLWSPPFLVFWTISHLANLHSTHRCNNMHRPKFRSSQFRTSQGED
jgi:hypothetical protein